MKRFFLLCLLLPALVSRAQLQVHIQLPPSGLSMKQQLWNILVSNNSTTAKQVHIELKLAEPGSSQQVLTARTTVFLIPPGNQQLQVNTVSPVQYNIIHPSYSGFAASEFLPVGNFLACYSFFQHEGDRQDKIGEECELIEIEPLSPPQLVLPYHQDTIETAMPVFNWLAPSPINLFTALNYDLELVEVLPAQSAADAIRLNIPMYRATNIIGLQHGYPSSAPALQLQKNYAWRIIAKNNQSPVATSENWQFTLATGAAQRTMPANDLPFVKLHKEDQGGYAISMRYLQFDYYNETSDTTWNIKVYDLSAKRTEVNLPMDSVRLKPGANLVRIDLANYPGLINKHLYLLELQNSRDERWRLRFEYREIND